MKGKNEASAGSLARVRRNLSGVRDELLIDRMDLGCARLVGRFFFFLSLYNFLRDHGGFWIPSMIFLPGTEKVSKKKKVSVN